MRSLVLLIYLLFTEFVWCLLRTVCVKSHILTIPPWISWTEAVEIERRQLVRYAQITVHRQ